MINQKTIASSALFLVLLAGCAGKELTAVPVNESLDTCDACHMSVKDNGYAAEALTANGKVYKFDDIGCLAGYLKGHPDIKPAVVFIQDVSTREWLSAKDAFYVEAGDVQTPMEFGIHAFKTADAAGFFAKAHPGARALKWKEVSSIERKMEMN